MRTREENLTVIREACVVTNNEILDRWAELSGSGHGEHDSPIRLADILLALDNKNPYSRFVGIRGNNRG